MNRRHLAGVVLAALACVTAPAAAQDRTVRVIVPYAPGGNIDALARAYSKELGELLKENWIVENVAGANGVIGTERVARAPANGATLLFSADVHSMLPLLVKRVPYDPIRDFTPVALVAKAPLMFVVNAEGVKSGSLRDLVGEIRAQPWRLFFQPAKKDLEADALFRAATYYADATAAVRATSESLTNAMALAQASPAGTGPTPETIAEQLKLLRDSMQEYKKAERDLLDVLILQAGQKPPVPKGMETKESK